MHRITLGAKSAEIQASFNCWSNPEEPILMKICLMLSFGWAVMSNAQAK